jgi:hypothetical protein
MVQGMDELLPDDGLTINLRHWKVENKYNYVRDLSFNDDRCDYRKNPQVFAALNNLAISLCRLCGTSFLPSLQRLFRADNNSINARAIQKALLPLRRPDSACPESANFGQEKLYALAPTLRR